MRKVIIDSSGELGSSHDGKFRERTCPKLSVVVYGGTCGHFLHNVACNDDCIKFDDSAIDQKILKLCDGQKLTMVEDQREVKS